MKENILKYVVALTAAHLAVASAASGATVILASSTGGMQSTISESFPRTTVAHATLQTTGRCLLPANSGTGSLTIQDAFVIVNPGGSNFPTGLVTDLDYNIHAQALNLNSGATIQLQDAIYSFDGVPHTTYLSDQLIVQYYRAGLQQISATFPIISNSSTSDEWEITFVIDVDISNIGVTHIAFANSGGFVDTPSGYFTFTSIPECGTATMLIAGFGICLARRSVVKNRKP